MTGGKAYVRLVALGALVGIPAALAGALFLGLIHELQHVLWTDLPDALGESSPPWYLLLGLPVAGAALVIVARRLLPGDGGHDPLAGLSTDPTPLSHAPGVLLAATGTLGFGIVLGPEAPVIALGSVVALAVTSIVTLDEREGRVLGLAGSFSAISALFGGPIVAGVMMLEAGVGLGAALLPAMLPGFVAAAVGYLIIIGFGDWGGLDAPGLAVPNLPVYDGEQVLDLIAALVVGVTVAVTIFAVRKLAKWVRERERGMGMTAALLGGGLAVGAIALVADWLGANSQDVLFSGQQSIPAVIAEESTGIVLLLIAAKAIAYAVSLACGFRGGPIFPAVFLGVGIAALPVVWFDASPTLAIAIGAAAGMAAQARLLLTSMLFGGLLVGTPGVDAVPAAVIAAAAAWMTIMALDPPPKPAAG
ncbi:MAG: chloride channel protein [Thermoleophilaceae bacterium]|nr:chloride channel protein [Thermoleophilaceae bacterium]